jgi:uncharacterized protein YcbK (DUF882 family)
MSSGIMPTGTWVQTQQEIIKLLRELRDEAKEERSQHKQTINECTKKQSEFEIKKTSAKKNLSTINSTIRDINTKIRFQLDQMEDD